MNVQRIRKHMQTLNYQIFNKRNDLALDEQELEWLEKDLEYELNN